MAHTDLCNWIFPPKDPRLFEDEVHVWCASLDLPSSDVSSLGEFLDSGELERAAFFHFKADRDRYIARHGLLRAILGRYLDLVPERLRFVCNAFGKPTLAPGFAQDEMRFNLSCSNGLALFAFARGREIGVDVERVRADVEIDEIARRFFSSAEYIALNVLPPKKAIRAFYNCWTRKEAYIKARGEGLLMPLDQFTVSMMPDEPPRLLDAPNDSKEVERWALCHLEPAPGYIAALAVEGQGWQLRCWRGDGWAGIG